MKTTFGPGRSSARTAGGSNESPISAKSMRYMESSRWHLTRPADHALQVARFAAGDRNGVVGGRAAAGDDLQVALRLDRALRDHIREFLERNESGATARDEHAVLREEP